MVGNTMDSCQLTMLGIDGDRHWAIRDLDRGGIRGAKRIGDLMQFRAQTVDNGVRITFPNGQTAHSTDVDINEKLSQALGVQVRLEPLPSADNRDHFRRGPAYEDDPMRELRSVFGRTDDEPLPNFAVFPPEVVEFESPPGTHYDCWPLMVMTTSALRALEKALPASVIDIRRFRPSLVIDGAPEGHPEFSWKGRRATIGTSEIEFLDPCPRCVMPTRRINDAIPEDRSILRHIVRDLDQNLGVYARIITPGTISTNDDVQFHN